MILLGGFVIPGYGLLIILADALSVVILSAYFILLTRSTLSNGLGSIAIANFYYRLII